MPRLAIVAAALLALPLVHAEASAPQTVAYVAERTSATARAVEVRGGAGARDFEYAMAAVASASVDGNGRFTGADGGLFFGSSVDHGASARTPVGDLRCESLPAGQACAGEAGAAIGFAVWWDDATFNRVLVVLHGRNIQVDLGEHGSPGWRLRRWTGKVKLVTDAMPADASAPLGTGAGAFVRAESSGGPRGSVAIGTPPCTHMTMPAGSGAVRLLGGAKDVLGTCADGYPPAAYAHGSTEWTLDGAAAGYQEVPVRLVVIEAPIR